MATKMKTNTPPFMPFEQDRHGIAAQIEHDIATLLPPIEMNTAPAFEGEPRRAAQLSAEAMKQEFEKGAKDIELMGSDLLDIAKRCEKHMQYVQEVFEHVKETAAHFRDAAVKIGERIEKDGQLIESVRRKSALMRQHLQAGEPDIETSVDPLDGTDS